MSWVATMSLLIKNLNFGVKFKFNLNRVDMFWGENQTLDDHVNGRPNQPIPSH